MKQEQETNIIEKYLKGYSSLDIAKSNNHQKQTVLRVLKRNNIPRRSLSEAHKLAIEDGKVNLKMIFIKNDIRLIGENNPNWKGGVTEEHEKIRKSPEYKLWKTSVFSRDNFTCQICNQVGGYLHAHHIKHFAECPELRFIIENGITLCKSCHAYLHHVEER